MSEALATLAATLASLRESGADRIDPVRFHFLETLAQRGQAQPDAVADALAQKLSASLAEYQARCRQAEKAARSAAKKNAKKAAMASPVAPSPLAELLSHIAASSLTQEASASETAVESSVSMGASEQTELKAVRYFRESWSKLSTDQMVTQSLASAPENAGPLNSHLLVLKAMELMRDVAPAYLASFMSYADTLLWLEQAIASLPSKKTPAGAEGEKKRKAPRGKSRKHESE